MTVLVTGGTGVIGSWVTRSLVERGVKPVLYDLYPDTELTKDVGDRVEIVRGDVTDLSSLLHAIKKYGIKRIIHMAATLPTTNMPLALKVNVEGTVNVFEAARIMDLERVVYTSARGVLGEIKGVHGHPTYEPLNEDYPSNPDTIPHGPISVYSTTKLMGEHIGLNYHHTYGVGTAITRFAMTYGPGKLARHGPFAISSRLIENAMLGKLTRIPKGGEAKDDWVYNRDCGDGVVLACYAESLKHRIFNIGTGQGVTLYDVAEVLKRLFPEASFEIGPGSDYLGFLNYCVYDVTRASEELGFTPKYGIEDGIKDYVETMKRLDVSPMYTP